MTTCMRLPRREVCGPTTPVSGAPAAKGPSWGRRRTVWWSMPHNPCRKSSILSDVHPAEGWEHLQRDKQGLWLGEGEY